MDKEVVQTIAAPAAIGPYPRAIKAGEMVLRDVRKGVQERNPNIEAQDSKQFRISNDLNKKTWPEILIV